MNKIFKIIWSKTLNQLVVTSELSRGESKASSTETAQKERTGKGLSLKATYSTIALLVAATLPTAAMAGRNEHGGQIGNTNANTIAIGNASYASGHSAVAIGGGQANPDNTGGAQVGTIALGWSTAKGDSAIAQGTANAVGNSALALGGLAQAYGTSAIAFGKGARVGSLNTSTSNGSSGDVNGGIAIGQDARVAGDEAAFQPVKNAIAIGTGAQAWSNNSVALGAGSVAGYTPNAPLSAGGTGLVKDTIKNNLGGTANAQNLEQALGITKGVGKHDFAGLVTADESGQYSNVVSVGRGKGNNESTKPLYRQIINVGAGRITADSTDAINGSQLYQVLKYLKEKNIVSVDDQGNDTTNTNGGGAGGGASSYTVKTVAGTTSGVTKNDDITLNAENPNLTFGAGEGLEVTSQDGKVVYGLESGTLQKFNTLDDSVAAAKTAASNAQSSATAASNSATAASTSASQAGSSATAASTSASQAGSSATAASTSASQAGSSATAASTSASAADSSASAASTSASAADSSASAAS
ncbi:ESPR-type extended signal peptide-containing protein, partial [Avibacterium endocarditidis]|uniref:ESPR-type extended signal peptide-containing protein n=1 Tax=Avibacterium endocarditidis TaxID=380674 RepID=UPI0039FCFF10